ncbi:MAG: NeuD/PglB/VioB family sugar acetyltransferase [Candidatus Hydrogenedentes bacterium]|nr:NeuD/PglB/VioB family sugar acetyltransferase [Candidatus Hydrogenedentota bacterium]
MKDRAVPVIMPQLGVNDLEITVTEWLLEPGTRVHVGQPIALVETSKANLELTAEAEGFLYPCVEAGAAVPIGRTIAVLAEYPDPEIAEKLVADTPPPTTAAKETGTAQVTEKARLLIEQHHIDPARLPLGRIIREQDVLALLAPPRAEVPDALQRRVVIYGASQGGLAVLECVASMKGHEVIAFLEDDPALIGSTLAGLPVWAGARLDKLRAEGIGAVSTHIAKASTRLRLLARWQQAGLHPLNVIHARAIVSPSVRMGVGNLIKAGAVLDTEVELGDGCIVDNGAIVPHHNRIGTGCHLAPGVSMGGDCIIGECSVIGIGATISARLRVGRNVIVAAGACVLRDVPDNVVVEGNPARIVGERK